MDFEAIPWRTTRYEGIEVHFYSTDRRTGRVTALIRMQPGRGYPRHRHRGQEQVLVLQGSSRDEFGDHATGQFVDYDDGTSHSPVAGEGAPCVLLAVAHEGVVLE